MPIVQHEVLRKLSYEVFNATGIPEGDARIVSDHLVTSNLVGHDTHGVWYVARYARAMMKRQVTWEDREVLRESPILQVFDGHGADGIVTLTKAVDIAVEKARQSSIGFVGVRNVTHMGRLGDYPPRIAQHGMVGMIWTNSGGLAVGPFGSAERKLRLAPVAYAVPRRDGPPLMLDMTLSVVAGGKVEQKIVRDEPIPEGWLIDDEGKYVTDGDRYHDSEAAILPLGGLQFGHKGHGMGMMMEMIVGPLTQAGCTDGDKGGGGIMIIAIDIESFTDLDTYKDEVENFVAWVRSAKRLPGVDNIYAPGEIEEDTRRRRLAQGINVPEPTWAEIVEIAEELGVPMPTL
jgi:uncharacterized oxidoreductase